MQQKFITFLFILRPSVLSCPVSQVGNHCLKTHICIWNNFQSTTFISKGLTPQKHHKYELICEIAAALTVPCRAQHRWLSVLLSFSPVEVRIAKADCQTLDVLLCLLLSDLTGLHRLLDEWCEMTLKYLLNNVCSCRGMCSAPRQMLSSSVCVAIRPEHAWLYVPPSWNMEPHLSL